MSGRMLCLVIRVKCRRFQSELGAERADFKEGGNERFGATPGLACRIIVLPGQARSDDCGIHEQQDSSLPAQIGHKTHAIRDGARTTTIVR